MKGLLIYIGSFVAVGGIVLGLSLSSTNLPSISAAGSSTVFPLMSVMAQEYKQGNLNVVAGGSGLGIANAQQGLVDIGNASKYADPVKDVGNQYGWNNLRTFTLAEDSLTMVTKLPQGCSMVTTGDNQLELDWTSLYKAYSQKNSMTYAQLFTVNGQSTVVGSSCGKTVTTLTRQNPATSGTAEIFINYVAALGDPSKNKSPLQNDKNANITTLEANSATMQQLSELNDGITYLSYGFFEDNARSFNDIHAVALKFSGDPKYYLPTTATTHDSTKYNWVRPLNSIMNIKDKAAVDIMKWWFAGISDMKTNPNNDFAKMLSATGYYISGALMQSFLDQVSPTNITKSDKDIGSMGVLVGDPTINKNVMP